MNFFVKTALVNHTAATSIAMKTMPSTLGRNRVLIRYPANLTVVVVPQMAIESIRSTTLIATMLVRTA